MPCYGYRDTQQLRVWNESQSVARKALQAAPQFEPKSLSLSLDFQARDAFFAYYIASRCWDFLKPYYHPTDSPEYLTLAIEAVSLAYLWHQVYSDAALATARQKYVSALSMTNKTLKSSKKVATKDTVLMASLLLDLFEKITDSEPRNNKSWTSHVDGALALVKFRGLDHFQHPSDFSILVRLSLHYIVGCVASGAPVPEILNIIQTCIGKRLSVQDPTFRLSSLMIEYANLGSEVRRGVLSNDEQIELSIELDGKLQTLAFELPPSWQYTAVFLDHSSDRAFDLHYDVYPNPRVCQARNIIRVLRILLNEFFIENHQSSPTRNEYLSLIGVANDNIEMLTSDICACVPQYVDCDSAARHRLPASAYPSDHRGPEAAATGHSHSPNHQLECYTLIFPLYIAGRSQTVHPDVKPWIIEQLHYISSHFYVRNAGIVAKMLERGESDATSPWEVYAMLGSYAFAS